MSDLHTNMSGSQADRPHLTVDRRGEFGWVILEFARAPSATLIFMFIFAPYFTRLVVDDTVTGVEYWGLANSIGAVMIAVLSPALGAIVDRMGSRKPWIAIAVLLLAACEASLWFALPAGQGGLSWQAIVALIACCALMLELSAMLHNAMLDSVGPLDRAGHLSGLGYLASNTGTLLALTAMLVLIVLPAQGTLDTPSFLPGLLLDRGSHEPDRIVGPFAAFWLLAGSLPFLLLTPDRKTTGAPFSKAVLTGLRQLAVTVRKAREHANIGRFLLARMAYNDAIIALQAYAAIYAADVFGWVSSDIIMFALALATACAAGGYLAAYVDTRLGSWRTIVIGNIAIIALLVMMVSCGEDRVFFLPIAPSGDDEAASAVSQTVFVCAFLSLGAIATMVLVSSRALLVKLAPPGMATQFFGLYSLSGYATAFAGHALVAGITGATQSLTWGITSLLLLLIIGLAMMQTVSAPSPGKRA